MMRRWYPAAIVAIAFALSAAAYSRLPAHIPIHWGADWQPNGWAGRGVGAFGLPVLMAAIAALLRALPRLDSRPEQYARFAASYETIVAATLLMMLVGHAAMLAAGIGMSPPLHRIFPITLGVFLVAVGNVLPRVRSNAYIGVRTPWTRSDDRVWARTQRVAGYVMVAAGALFVLDGIATTSWASHAAATMLIAGAVLATVLSAIQSTRA